MESLLMESVGLKQNKSMSPVSWVARMSGRSRHFQACLQAMISGSYRHFLVRSATFRAMIWVVSGALGVLGFLLPVFLLYFALGFSGLFLLVFLLYSSCCFVFSCSCFMAVGCFLLFCLFCLFFCLSFSLVCFVLI